MPAWTGTGAARPHGSRTIITTLTLWSLALSILLLAGCSTLEKATDVTEACMPQLQELRACVKQHIKQAQPAPTT